MKNSGLRKVQRQCVQQPDVRTEQRNQPLHPEQTANGQHDGDQSARSAGDWLDALIALVSLILSLPLLLFAMLLTKLADGGPVLWLGERLGKRRKPFLMYKIRSLAIGAEAITEGRLLTLPMAAKLNVEHRFGRFLRESRLDEIPQFINVIKGDMRLFGPRPVRRIIYEQECREIPGYDRRFTVKPGLFGYSQVLTPHSSDKRIRKKLDNYLVANEPSLGHRLLFLSGVLFVLVFRLPFVYAQSVRKRNGGENRKLYRVPQSRCRVRFVDASEIEGIVTNLSDNAMSILLSKDAVQPDSLLRLEVRQFLWSRLKQSKKIAYCRLLSAERRPAGSNSHPYAYVFQYQPTTPLNHYLIQKYLLRRSLL